MRSAIKITFKNSKDVFVLFSALNSMGYDDENNSRGMSSIRKKVRSALLKHGCNKKYPQLKKIIEKYHPWYFLNTIFAKQKKYSLLSSFVINLKKFAREPFIRKMWNVFKAYQVKETKKLLPLFKKETARLILFIKTPPRKIKKLVLVSNPLDAYWRGYGFTIGGIGYVVAGPGAEKHHGELIRHELLHVLAPRLRLPKWITAGRHRNRLTALGYKSPNIINREYVVRSLNLVYESIILRKNISTAVKRENKNFKHIREAMEFIKSKIIRGRP